MDVGYNSTLIIINDALHQIENDKEFGLKVSKGVKQKLGKPRIDISSGNHHNAASIIDCHRADRDWETPLDTFKPNSLSFSI